MSKAGQQGAGIPVTFEMITEAREALKGIAEYTPMIRGRMPGTILSIKAENLQRTGSFKIRGAYNKLRSLSPEEAARGVIACSAGNHAQGVALSATRLGIRSVICMPASAPILKVEATRSYGGEVVLVDGNYDDSANRAAELAAEYGYTVALSGNVITHNKLSDIAGIPKLVPPDHQMVEVAKDMGISFGI